MEFTLPNGNQLYYEWHTAPNATQSIICLNGLTQTTQAWGPISMGLQGRYNVLLVDFLFQGQSSNPAQPLTFAQHAQSIAALVQHLNPAQPLLAGISYGGVVAQHLLLNHPELFKGALVISSFAQQDAFYKALINSWVQALELGQFELFQNTMLPLAIGRRYYNKPFIPIEQLIQTPKDPQAAAQRVLALLHATTHHTDMLAQLAQIKVPVWLVHGTEDLIAPPAQGQAMATHLPQGQLKTIDNAGHTLTLDAFRALHKIMIEFANATQ